MADNQADKKSGNSESGTYKLADRIAEKAERIKYVAIAVLVLLLVAIAVFSYLRRDRAKREAVAEAAVFRAQVDAERVQESDPKIIALLGDLAKNYSGLPAGIRAEVLRFAEAFAAKDYATAESAARDFLKTYPNNIFASRAKLALAQSLIMQNKTAEAITTLRQLTGTRDPGTYPEAKLALAQAMERDAESVKSDAAEYRRRLEAAAEEYNDIVGQARATNQREFWPQTIVLPADFSLVLLRDRLAGYTHQAPRPAVAPAAEPSAVDAADMPPPPAEGAAADAPANDVAGNETLKDQPVPGPAPAPANEGK